jgi:hypothetical protein
VPVAGGNNSIGYMSTDATGDVGQPAKATDVFRRRIPRLPVCRRVCRWSTSVTGSATHPAIPLELYAHALQQPGHVLAETFDRLLDDPWRPGDLINSRRRD